jgi:3-methylcrotonyl-CoA carboxylase alpha subunit
VIASLLIANRGEIACRITRTARRMGIRVIAVYSEADGDALHVEMADEAVLIGPAPARESYLNIERIIAAAQAAGADAVHPGYGFLSENAGFAEACAAAGLTFIGPPASAIRAMGSKAEAKRIMAAAGVPLVPGYHGTDQSPALLAAEAVRIGFPVLIKASAGGGGKGMRVVEREADFALELAAAKREAASSFGDERVLIERYLARPRHIEVQIFADCFGKTIALFERDCSIQRRHQKIIEEAPAPNLPAAMRAALADAACKAASAVGYVNAGTVEFIAEGNHFYFMEMNTRLQVEHPVTEFVTGLDLVEWQIRVAQGEPLADAPEKPSGHAIEARLYAEDPARDFMPATGRIEVLRTPPPQPWLRIDSGVRQGDRIGTHYDPMIGKLIVHGTDRTDAVRKLRYALDATALLGLRTNVALLAAIAGHKAFDEADLDTGFIARNSGDLTPQAPALPLLLSAAALIVALGAPVGSASGFRLNLPSAPMMLVLAADDAFHQVTVAVSDEAYHLRADALDVRTIARIEDDRLIFTLRGQRWGIPFYRQRELISLWLDGAAHDVRLVDPLAPPAAEDAASGGLAAPMPGTLIRLLVIAGQTVLRAAPLAVMEAMKMQLTISAPHDGVIGKIFFSEGDLVPEGAILFALDPPLAQA